MDRKTNKVIEGFNDINLSFFAFVLLCNLHVVLEWRDESVKVKQASF